MSDNPNRLTVAEFQALYRYVLPPHEKLSKELAEIINRKINKCFAEAWQCAEVHKVKP